MGAFSHFLFNNCNFDLFYFFGEKIILQYIASKVDLLAHRLLFSNSWMLPERDHSILQGYIPLHLKANYRNYPCHHYLPQFFLEIHISYS